MNRRLRIALLLLMIFAGGAFVGWLAGRASAPAPAPERQAAARTAENVMKEMETALRLTPEQRERVAASVEEWRRQVRRIAGDALEQRRQLFEQMSATIRTNLTPAQQRLLDRKSAAIRSRFQRALRNLETNSP